jgi:abelson tyrosine-protein kinase 1
MACIRLTERSVDILVFLCEEIYEAGDEVTEELKEPIRKLTESAFALLFSPRSC